MSCAWSAPKAIYSGGVWTPQRVERQEIWEVKKRIRDAVKDKQGLDEAPPTITSNVKQNLQFLKLWSEFQKRKLSAPKPTTRYRKKKTVKEELPEDTELYQDLTSKLY